MRLAKEVRHDWATERNLGQLQFKVNQNGDLVLRGPISNPNLKLPICASEQDSGTLHASWKNLMPLIWVMSIFLSETQDLWVLSLHFPFSCLWWQNGDHQDSKSLSCSQVYFKVSSRSEILCLSVPGFYMASYLNLEWPQLPTDISLSSREHQQHLQHLRGNSREKTEVRYFQWPKAFLLTKLLSQLKLVHPWNLSVCFSFTSGLLELVN